MRRLLSIAALVSIGLTTVTAPAHASDQSGNFCNVTDSGTLSCYDSEPVLLHVISGGRINVGAGASRTQIAAAIEKYNSSAQSSSNSGESPNTTVILGQLWNDAGYTGGNLAFTAGNTCASGINATFNNFAAGYNNTASSMMLYAGCYGRGYDSSTASGSGTQYQFGYEAQVSNLGSFNDLMSSVKFCHSSC